MKKNLAKKVTLSILAGTVLMSSSVVWAANNPDVIGWTKNSDYYVWNDTTGGAPDGEIDESDGNFSYHFYGKYDDDNLPNTHATDGKVTIISGTFNGDHYYVYGGYSKNDHANATKNSVVVEGGTISTSIFGGRGDSATNNSVIINGGRIEEGDYGEIYGGYGVGSATSNSVTINGGNINNKVYGGYSSEGIAGGTVENGNVVTITGGSINGNIYGGSSYEGLVDSNKVNIGEGTNTISIKGKIYGGESTNGDASNNEVNISRGTLGGSGTNEAIYIYGGYSTYNDAKNNKVTISGGTIHGIIAGGGTFWDVMGSSGEAYGNVIRISGSANLEDADLYGGIKADANGKSSVYGGVGTPNTLNIGKDSSGWSDKVKSIQGFDVINFNNVNWNKNGTVIEATNLELRDTKITVNITSGTLNANEETMNLIETANPIQGNIASSGNAVNVGIANSYTGSITKNEKAIVVTLTGNPNNPTTPQPSRNDQVLVLGESRAAAVAFTNQGSELIETGLNALARDNEKDTKVFAAVYGNHSEYETGSHVNVNGWSGIVGVGKTNDNGLTVGAFFENGEGNYSTHNIFTDDYIRGDGEACYNGGGFLVRKDNANGVYAEASLRAGNLQNELRGAVRNGADLTGYDVDTFYYGAHIGIGKVIPRGNEGDSLDVYGKFIYTHHDGETFDIGGTATKFDSVESERLRLGFRLNEVQTNKLSMYYGAAWEYEFNGDAHDKIASFDLETPSLEGSTVIGEIGAHYKASDKWSIDLNGRAYVGQREGFSGSVQANYSF